MGIVYCAKAASAAATTTPTGWPSGWTISFAGPFPPGFPTDPGAVDPSLELTGLGATYADRSVVSLTLRCLDEGADTDLFDGQIIEILPYIGSSTCNVKMSTDTGWSTNVLKQISNYSGGSYGIQVDVIFDTEGHEGETLTVYGRILAVEGAISTSDTAAVVSDHTLVVATSTTSVTRGTDFTLTVTAKDKDGATITTETGDVTLSLSEATDAYDILDNNGTPIETATLVAGTWTTAQAAISGGSGSGDTCKISAALTGYATGESSTLTVSSSSPVLTPMWVSNYATGGGKASWSAARAAIDADAPTLDTAFPTGGVAMRQETAGGGNYYLTRGGWKITNLSGQTSATFKWNTIYWTSHWGATINIRASTTAPATGAEMRTLGTVVGTFSVQEGVGNESGTVDVSTALAGSPAELYVWAVLEYDTSNSFPSGTDKSTIVNLTEMELG